MSVPILSKLLSRAKSDFFGSWIPFSALTLMLATLVAYQGWTSYQSETEDADRHAENLTYVLANEFLNKFKSVDNSLAFVVEQLKPEEMVSSTRSHYQIRVGHLLELQVRLNHLSNSIRIYDAKGDQLYGSNINEKLTNVSDREYFSYLRDHPEVNQYFSEKVVIGKHSQLPLLIFVRAIRSQAGEFLGLASTSIPISTFEDELKKIAVGEHGAIAVRTIGDGNLIYRFPEVLGQETQKVSESQLQKAMIDHDSGTLRAASQVDGITRMFAYKKLSPYPYFINLGLDESNYLSRWRRDTAFTILGAVILDALIGLFFFRQRRAYQKLNINLEALELSQHQLKLINSVVANANDMVIITEAEPRDQPGGPAIVFVNEAFIRKTGYSASEVIGKNCAILQGPNSPRAPLDRIRLALEKWQPIREEVLNYKKNGEEFWVDLEIIPIADETGWFTHWISIERDTTNKRVAEEQIALGVEALKNALEASEQDRQRLRLANSALAKANDVVIITEAKASEHVGGPSIVFVNEAFERETGYSSSEVVGRNSSVLRGPKTDRATSERIRKCLESAQPVREEILNYKKNGEEFWQELNISPLVDEGGQLTHWVSVQRNITERKRVEADLSVAKETAEAALVAKTQFLSNMSHEIRTPMNGIIGLSTLALNKPLSPEVHDYLVSIESSAKSLLTILNDVLDFSKLEAGKVQIDQIPFQLQDLFVSAKSLFDESAKTKGLELVCHTNLDHATKLIGDPFRIGQVLNNLIGNAIKFTEQGSVTFSVGLRGMENSKMILRLSVKDTGIGVPAGAMDKLMQPFTQADGSITRRFGGTGLGLAISNQLLEVMGSKLNVTSAEGQGSTFSFDLALGAGPAK